MFVIFKCCSHFGTTCSNSLLNASVVHSCVKCWHACATRRVPFTHFRSRARFIHKIFSLCLTRSVVMCDVGMRGCPKSRTWQREKWGWWWWSTLNEYRTNITSILTAYHIRINIFFVASCPFDCYCVYSVSYRYTFAALFLFPSYMYTKMFFFLFVFVFWPFV